MCLEDFEDVDFKSKPFSVLLMYIAEASNSLLFLRKFSRVTFYHHFRVYLGLL